MKPALVLLAAIAALAAACGTGSRTASPTGTAAVPTATPAPAVVGPVLVYTQSERTPDSITEVLHAYDAGARRELQRLALGPAGRVALRPHSDEVLHVSSLDSARFEIRAWSATTGADRVVYTGDGATEWSIAVSPDGAEVAFTEIVDSGAAGSTVNALTIDSGAVRTLATFGSPLSETFRDTPVPRAWRPDGRGILVSGDTGSGAAGSWGTVGLDGSVQVSATRYGWPSPTGRWLADAGFGETGCVFGVQRLQIWDVDARAVTAEVTDPERGIVLDDWSPDGQSVLYRQYAPKTPPREGDCVPDYDRATERAFLLPASGGSPTPVADVAALRREWNRGHDITTECVAPSSPPGAVATPGVFGGCDALPVALVVDGQVVSTGGDPRILGVIDSTDLAPARTPAP